MKIQIKARFTDMVLFEGSYESTKEALVKAVEKKANLRSANLRSANLRSANLRSADLRSADLRSANLYGADLYGANLYGANLYGADLRSANLRSADLRSANLYGADLRSANLRSADLRSANLYGADLKDAKNAELVIAQTVILPGGDIIGYKKCCDNVIVKLRIPEKAKRSSASGRKCRAEFAEVLEIRDFNDKKIKSAVSQHDSQFTYKPGDIVKPKEKFDPDRWNECASGIHFYITLEEAKAH